VVRFFEIYELMKYTPTRLFAVFIPLFFLFYLSRGYREGLLRKPLQIAILVPIIILSLWAKIPLRGFYQAESTYQAWQQKTDDMAQVFGWLKNNTEQNALIMAPPWRYDFWYLSERSEVVNFEKPVMADVNEWQVRVEEFTGTSAPTGRVREAEDMAKFYFSLGKEKVDELAKKYKADYFISESDYSYPVIYAKGKVRVYQLK
jgi:hypothetical protein